MIFPNRTMTTDIMQPVPLRDQMHTIHFSSNKDFGDAAAAKRGTMLSYLDDL